MMRTTPAVLRPRALDKISKLVLRMTTADCHIPSGSISSSCRPVQVLEWCLLLAQLGEDERKRLRAVVVTVEAMLAGRIVTPTNAHVVQSLPEPKGSLDSQEKQETKSRRCHHCDLNNC